MPHGFLNYGIPNGISQAKKCVNDSSEIFQEIMTILKNKADN